MTKMRGKKHESLDYPPMPAVFSPLVSSYSDLSDYSFQEIKAYRDMTGISLDLFDVGIIKDIDYVKRSIANGSSVNQVMEVFGWRA